MTWITRTALEALSPQDRTAALAELREAGHDLWSHDYDGESRQLWGWDYMRMQTAGQLQIQFNFGRPCQTFWRDDDGRLGVDRGDGA